jgi:hypothetical protein
MSRCGLREMLRPVLEKESVTPRLQIDRVFCQGCSKVRHRSEMIPLGKRGQWPHRCAYCVEDSRVKNYRPDRVKWTI